MDLIERHLIKGQTVNRHPWELARSSFVGKLFSEHCPAGIRSRSLVLDIGCGDALVTENLATHYPEVSFIGIDSNFDDPMVGSFSGQPVLRNLFFRKTLPEADIGGGTVSCIMLLDLLEHVEGDGEFMLQLTDKEFVGQDTVFIVTVPAFMALFSRHDRFLGHYRRYNLTGLHALLGRANLYVIESGYVFFVPMIIRAFQVLLEKFDLESDKSWVPVSGWRGGNLSTRVLTALCLLDARSCRILSKKKIYPGGLSCFACCRKRV